MRGTKNIQFAVLYVLDYRYVSQLSCAPPSPLLISTPANQQYTAYQIKSSHMNRKVVNEYSGRRHTNTAQCGQNSYTACPLSDSSGEAITC